METVIYRKETDPPTSVWYEWTCACGHENVEVTKTWRVTCEHCGKQFKAV